MFIPGITPIPASGAVIGIEEKDAMIAQVQKGWLTAGPANKKFEADLAKQFGTAFAHTCNSGSSANLLAVGAMVESGRWKAGDEIITTAAAFPTTVNPLLLYGIVPVFVDVELESCNATFQSVDKAITKQTKGIMLAHTLGHPFPKSIIGLALAAGFPIVQDCCDAAGSMYKIGNKYSKLGEFGGNGALTCSFFPAHHITTGEGGAVFTQSPDIARLVDSLSSWGRDCYCDPGADNTCGKRFEYAFDGLPEGYDHKYTFTALGYNLKMTEIQAVCGLEQLGKVEQFVEKRRANFAYLWKKLEPLQDHIMLPVAQENVLPSWFGFTIILKQPGERRALQQYLDRHKIGSRLLFGGNITRQPYMKGRNFRIAEPLTNTDKIMEDALWIGVWPGLTFEMLDYVVQKIEDFFE